MRISAFEGEGSFYKGNIHTHSDISDGRLPVEELVRIYRGLGYDFIALTDHNKVFKSDDFNDRLYILPGLEIHSRKGQTQKTHHIVALTSYDNDKVQHGQLIDNFPWSEAAESAVNLSRDMKKMGFELVYCHSVWSRMDPEEFIDSDITAMEVYNGVCELNYNQGNQELHWDYLLRRGKKAWGVAADDCHGGEGQNGRGFIMVKCHELNDREILRSIRNGSFYSSRGPIIHDFYVEDEMVTITCSPAKRITFITYEFLGGSQIFEEPTERFSMKIHPETIYIRAEVEDEKGLKAWTNPLFLR